MHRFSTFVNILRGDAKRLPRILVLTILSIGIYNFGWGFADPFFSLYVSQFTTQYTVIGFCSSLMSVLTIVLLFMVGPLLDRCRHQTLIDAAKVGYFFVGLFYFLAGQWHSLTMLLIAIILNGALIPMVWTSTLATLEKYTDEKDTTLTFGLYASVRQLMWGCGLAVSLLVVWKFPLHYIYIPVMIFPLLSILVTRHVKEEGVQPFFAALKAVVVEDRVLVRMIRELRLFATELRWAFVLTLFTYIVYMIGMTYVPLYAMAQGYTHVQTGLLLLVMGSPFFVSFLTAEMADHSERFRNIIVGLIVSSIALGGLAQWGQGTGWHLFACGFLLMAGFAIIEPSLSAIVTMLTPKKESGTSSAVMGCMVFLSVVVFSPVMGFLIDGYGWQKTFIVCALFCFCLALLTSAIRRQFKKKNLLYRLHHPHDAHNPYVL